MIQICLFGRKKSRQTNHSNVTLLSWLYGRAHNHWKAWMEMWVNQHVGLCSIGDRDVLVLLNLLVMSPNSSTEIRTSKERKFQPISHHSFTPIRQGWLNYGDAKHWWKSNSKKISALICVLTLHKRTQLIKSISKIKSNEGGEPPGIVWSNPNRKPKIGIQA